MRSVGNFSWLESVLLCSLQSFDSVDWVTGRTSNPYKHATSPQRFCCGTSEKLGEPVYPDSLGERPTKQSRHLCSLMFFFIIAGISCVSMNDELKLYNDDYPWYISCKLFDTCILVMR